MDHIKRFPSEVDAVVSEFTEELKGKEVTLQGMRRSLTKLLRDYHVAEIIRQNKDNQARFEEAASLQTGNCGILREMVVASTGKYPILNKPKT